MKKRKDSREVYLDEETYQMWLGFCDPEQKDFLMAVYHTGCRPAEVVGLGADEGTGFDEGAGTWVVSARLRVVALDPVILDLSKRLRAKNSTGAMFRSGDGKPWTVHRVWQMIRRFRERSAERKPERAAYYRQLTPHTFRPTVAANSLREDEDPSMIREQEEE